MKGHTTALLLTTVGNGIFMFIIICSKIVLGLMNFLAVLLDGKGYVRIFFMILGGLFNIILLVFLFLGQAILAANSRKNEYQADYFAYERGYGQNLVDALYIFYEMTTGKKMSVKERIVAGIKASHPHVAKRIGRLETIIDGEEEADQEEI